MGTRQGTSLLKDIAPGLAEPYGLRNVNGPLFFGAGHEIGVSGDKVAGLDLERSPPDRFELRGREIFLHCPSGVGRTRLTNDYFDTKLATTSTMRNWRTVLKLVAMTGEL
jgi:hypothetical protein